jgi:hypothetical protein
MTITIETFIEELKAQHPTLTKGDDATGYEEMSPEEYDELILSAANDLWRNHQKEQERLQKIEQKTAVLERLGLTPEELDALIAN